MAISDFISTDRLISTFSELIGINSPSFGEREIGAVLARRLEEAGCRTEFGEYGRSFNLLGFKKGSIPGAACLLLSGHMDTIEPTEGITFSVEKGIFRTTGATVLGADDKSALAQIIEALFVLKEKDIAHGDIEIVFTSAEEEGLLGAKNIDFSKLRSKHALVLDSTGPVGRIVTASPSHVKYRMTITGKAAHAGIEPEKGISAIRAAARIISEIPDGRLDDETTANVGIISGGSATNVVPKEVVVRGELRSHNDNTLQRTKEGIFATAKAVAEQFRAGILISEEKEYSAFRIAGDEPFLRYLSDVYRTCGLEPICGVTGGGSDASVFNERGITALNISTGMQNVHSTEEYITLKDLVDGCAVTLEAVARFGTYRF